MMINEKSPRRDIAAAMTADGSYLDRPAIIAWLLGAPLVVVIIIALLL